MGFTPVMLRHGICTKAAQQLSSSGASAAAGVWRWWAASCSRAIASSTGSIRAPVPPSFSHRHCSSCNGMTTARAGLDSHHGADNHSDRSSSSYNHLRRESAAGYHVKPSSSMRGVVFWEPNRPVSLEYLQIPRPKSGELLIKTKGNPYCLLLLLFQYSNFSAFT